MNNLKSLLGIDEKFTRIIKKPAYNKVKDNIPLIEDYNFMADILHLPTDKFGYCKLLVVLDLATDEFDIEALKSDGSSETLKAFEKMTQRQFVKIPEASITTDGGSSFKGVFQSYLHNKNIFHKTCMAGRHQQLANVDNLCRQLGRLFNGYMVSKEFKTGKVSKSWMPAIVTIRDHLNSIRRKELPSDITTHMYPVFDNAKIDKTTKKYIQIKPKYKIGDLVHRKYDEPHNALGKKQPTKIFREGDIRMEVKTRAIVNVCYYPGKNCYRYILNGLPNASYTDQELRLE
jgi:hypothetical protein